MIHSVHGVMRGKPSTYPIKEFEDREDALKAATDFARYGGDYIIKVWTDDKAVEYPSEEIYIRGVNENNKSVFGFGL